jgi:succinate-semialdehyde dehydrogenase/glutarate-semialdehyde dehydrogenase
VSKILQCEVHRRTVFEVEAIQMETISVRNPATGEEILKTVSIDPAQVDALVATARRSQENSWGRLSFQERGRFILRAKDYLFENIDTIAAAISKNNGKPLVESLTAEVIPMIQTIDFAVKNAQKILRPQKIKIGAQLPTKRAYVHYAPLGVVGIISPWNYPLSTPLAEVILGLMAGNAIILKPSEVTGLVNRQIQNIIDSMKLPPGVFQMIEGRGDVGAALARAAVDRIIVTGSVATGKRVMAAAADRLTPVTLELGGKDSMIVLDDADIDKASSAAVVGGFYNAGQTCCSVEKILVHEKIATPFLAALNKKLATLRTGESKDFKNDLGPVTFEGQKKTYHAQTKDFY